MMNELKLIERNIVSKNNQEVMTSIDAAINIVNEISNILLRGLENSNDKLLYTERMSRYFESYIIELNQLVEGSDLKLKFWASSLLMHYKIENPVAEEILIKEIYSGNIETASLSATILCRLKRNNVIEAINIRRKNVGIKPSEEEFFTEIINSFKK